MTVIAIRPDDAMQNKIKTLCGHYQMTQQELIRYLINDLYVQLIQEKGVR